MLIFFSKFCTPSERILKIAPAPTLYWKCLKSKNSKFSLYVSSFAPFRRNIFEAYRAAVFQYIQSEVNVKHEKCIHSIHSHMYKIFVFWLRKHRKDLCFFEKKGLIAENFGLARPKFSKEKRPKQKHSAWPYPCPPMLENGNIYCIKWK